MARNRIDECLFCGSVPCVCNKKVTQPKAIKPRVQAVSTSPVPVVAVKIPNRAAPSSVPIPPKLTIRNIVHQDEVDLRAALTAIADAELLPAHELKTHRAMLDLPSWRIDALIWRQG